MSPIENRQHVKTGNVSRDMKILRKNQKKMLANEIMVAGRRMPLMDLSVDWLQPGVGSVNLETC